MTPFWRQISSEYDRYGAKTQSLDYLYCQLPAASAVQQLDSFSQYYQA